MGGAQTRQITLANLDKFSHIGMFSGGSIAADDPALSDTDAFKKKVKVVFVSYGSREKTETAKKNHAALEKLGIKEVIRQIGVERVIEQIGAKELVKHIGIDAFVASGLMVMPPPPISTQGDRPHHPGGAPAERRRGD